MTDFNYKKYSLENLENWLHDAMSSGDATPHEIYDKIIEVVKDNYYHHKQYADRAYELLTLMNGHNTQYTEEELNAMCDKAELDDKKQKLDINSTYDDMIAAGYTMSADGFWIPPQKTDQVNRWVLPVELDGLSGECYVNLPDDLLERAGLKEGDMVHWIDRKDGSFEMRKVNAK